MKRGDITFRVMIEFARDLRALEQRAARQYRPIVEEILRVRSRDTRHIEETLDGLLDFCGAEAVLEMYRALCRHYWDIDPAATTYYVNAYRETWDGDGVAGQP